MEDEPKPWPSPGSVWLRIQKDGRVETVWLTEELASKFPEDEGAPYTVERWAVHGPDGKVIG
jgi:hypothetical protein